MSDQQSIPGIPPPARRGRPRKADAERDWYGAFGKWDFADRAAALKVLTILHQQLPAAPAKEGADGS